MAEQAPRPPIRTLFIQALFSLFLATVAFVVLTYAFLVPQLVTQSARIGVLEQQVAQLQDELAEAGAQADEVEVAPDAAPEPAAGNTGNNAAIADGGTSAAAGTP